MTGLVWKLINVFQHFNCIFYEIWVKSPNGIFECLLLQTNLSNKQQQQQQQQQPSLSSALHL